MRLLKGDVCFVTGGSSGIGLAVMRELVSRGFRVYGTSRKVPRGAVTRKESLDYVYLDLSDEASISEALELVPAREGHIDLLVNNAGFGVAGAAEDMPFADAEKQMDVNFFGPLRVMRAVLPHMRGDRGGRIITIGSLAAEFPVPFQSIYSASKAALRALTAAMRAETAPFQIELSVVEPGDTRTGFTAARVKPTFVRRLREDLDLGHVENGEGRAPRRVAGKGGPHRRRSCRAQKNAAAQGGRLSVGGAVLSRQAAARVVRKQDDRANVHIKSTYPAPPEHRCNEL